MIFRLSFLLKVGQMKVCQYPYLLSTKFFPSNQRKNLTFFFSLFPQKNLFLWPARFTQKKSGEKFSHMNSSPKMSDSEDEDEIPHFPPNLSEKLIPPTQFQKIHEWNILKKSSAKIRGKTNFHSKILNFTNPKFSPKFHLLKSHGKKSEIFAKPLAGGSTATSTLFTII